MDLIIQEIPQSKTPTVCLNMIVKNETKILYRLFDSVLKVIDCYCICDTGSTDNTIELIQKYFTEKNIPGKIVSEPFRDFSHNRNFSLRACLGMSDYVLFMDADMMLYTSDKLFSKNLLTLDFYYILQGSDDFYYKNVRIVKNDGRYSYAGVTHEYTNTPQNATSGTFEKNVIFINDIGDGGSKGNKFTRDVELLTRGIEEDPKNDRYHFYLANTLRDMGRTEEAIEMYKKRIKLGGWNQEIWFSYYRIGFCYKQLGKMPEAIKAWLDAYDIIQDRIENIFEIVHYYRVIGQQRLSKLFYDIAKRVIQESSPSERKHFLFLENAVYTYKCDYEYTIIAYYLKDKHVKIPILNVLNHCDDTNIINNVFSNMKFYELKLIPQLKKTMTFNMQHTINNVSYNFNSSSSSILPKRDNSGGFIMNVRIVNYTIDDKGNYHGCEKHIITINKYLELSKTFEIEREKLIDVDYVDRRYMGVEDVRLFYDDLTGTKMSFIGVGYHKENMIGVVHGKYYNPFDINEVNNISYSYNAETNEKTIRIMPVEIKAEFNANSQCEKNWIFAHIGGEKRVIYNWSPLHICKINDDEPEILKTVSFKHVSQYPKFFKHIRGSTCGFTFNNQIWFIVHIVSYEQPRCYYHMMLVFENDENMTLLRYSPIFKFDEHCIEYCIGLIVEDSRIITTYSTWDRTTNIAIYDKKYIDDMMIDYVKL